MKIKILLSGYKLIKFNHISFSFLLHQFYFKKLIQLEIIELNKNSNKIVTKIVPSIFADFVLHKRFYF